MSLSRRWSVTISTPVHFPTLHVLCGQWSQSPIGLLTTSERSIHDCSPPPIWNRLKRSGTPRPTSPTSQDLSRSTFTLFRVSYDCSRPLVIVKVGQGRLPSWLSLTEALETQVKFNPNTKLLRAIDDVSKLTLFIESINKVSLETSSA